MMRFISEIFAILWKDLLSELRSKEIATSLLVFALLVLVISDFAFDPDKDTIISLGPGILWIAFTFAGVLGLNRTFATEKENSCLEGLMLCPIDRAAIYWGKLAATFTFMLIVEAIMTPIRELDMAGAIGDTSIQARPATQDDFLEAIEAINPSVSDDEIEKYDQWNEEFGSA